MKTRRRTKLSSARGLALIEVVFVIGVVVLLVFVAVLPLVGWPAPKAKDREKGARCQNNLKQVGLAFRTWEGDHADRYPMSVSTNEGGSREWLAGGSMFRHLQAMSNEINNPNIVVCPSDDRKAAPDFVNLRNSNISYFIGLDADETKPAMWLAGDRNLVTNGVKLGPGLAVITTNHTIGWSTNMHNLRGNVLLTDGSVQQASSKSLPALLQYTGTNSSRLAVP